MFPGDAEFDDPLIDSEARGCRLELAGEGIVDDGKVARLLVTRNGGVPFVHLLNRETFFTGQRIDPRRQASAWDAEAMGSHDRFRPVNGVVLPHSVEVSLDGRQVQRTAIESKEANPEIDYGVFRGHELSEEKKTATKSRGQRGCGVSSAMKVEPVADGRISARLAEARASCRPCRISANQPVR